MQCGGGCAGCDNGVIGLVGTATCGAGGEEIGVEFSFRGGAAGPAEDGVVGANGDGVCASDKSNFVGSFADAGFVDGGFEDGGV